MELGINGKVALVTGAGQGIGRAIGLAFAAERVHVAFHYLSSKQGAEQNVREARNLGVKSQSYGVDLRDRAAVDRMVQSIEEDLGPIDIVVNNAAISAQNKFLDSTPEEWEPQIGVTVVGTMHVCQAALRNMVNRQQGSIIVMAGDSGRVGEARLAVTAAARAATMGFAKSLARETARYGVRVNVVSLGLVQTPNFVRHTSTDPEVVKRIEKMYPLRRLGQPEDVPPLVLLLSSDRTSWITGQVYSINGGYSMV